MIDVAEGRIWTGKQAYDKGLVDALGSLEDAIADAKQLGGLARDADVDYLILPKARSFMDSLMDKADGSQHVAAEGAGQLRRPGPASADLGDPARPALRASVARHAAQFACEVTEVCGERHIPWDGPARPATIRQPSSSRRVRRVAGGGFAAGRLATCLRRSRHPLETGSV